LYHSVITINDATKYDRTCHHGDDTASAETAAERTGQRQVLVYRHVHERVNRRHKQEQKREPVQLTARQRDLRYSCTDQLIQLNVM